LTASAAIEKVQAHPVLITHTGFGGEYNATDKEGRPGRRTKEWAEK